MGLRAHILKCGDISLKYGSVIILEDDLFVSPNFYDYATSALQFSHEKEYIGGISLYKHELNVCTLDNFLPLDEGYDNWYFQFASSWGQVWSKKHWQGFIKWYNENLDLTWSTKIPSFVRSWSEKSWLKYHIAYLINKDLFFLYPKVSLTTNFSDVGTHVGDSSTAYQVPLMTNSDKEYKFGEIHQVVGVYDAFFENTKLFSTLNLDRNKLTVDLYGHKESHGNDFLLTNKVLNYKIHASYGKFLKPIDANIFFNIFGNELFLYDLKQPEINKNKISPLNMASYNIKYISFIDSGRFFLSLGLAKINRFLKKIIPASK